MGKIKSTEYSRQNEKKINSKHEWKKETLNFFLSIHHLFIILIIRNRLDN